MEESVKGLIKMMKFLLLLLPAAGMLFPVLILLSGALMDSYELTGYLSPLIQETEEFISWRMSPQYPYLGNYGRLLFYTPSFYVLFWNSLLMVGGILAGQLLVGVPAAWGFAVYDTRAGRLLFALYVVLMLIPFQVTMLSTYLVLNRLKLLNTYGAVILPAVFSTFPVFLCYGGFREVPPELLEAARLDGAGELGLFLHVGLPLGKSGLCSAFVLGFLEYWNLFEQPMAFLTDSSLWPLSLYLPQISLSQAGFAFAASVITLIPAIFVFAFGQEHLEQGIIYSGLKG